MGSTFPPSAEPRDASLHMSQPVSLIVSLGKRVIAWKYLHFKVDVEIPQ